MTTPVWQAAENGISGHLAATNQSAQINQLLAAHEVSPVCQGTQILTPGGGTQFTWLTYGNGTDLDQPFTLSGTAVGRVVLPVKPVGSGADMTVTLYPDNGSGSPLLTSPIAATTVPGAAIGQLAAADGLENASGPLVTAASNTLYLTGDVTTVTDWASPSAPSGNAPVGSAYSFDGNFVVSVGGTDGPASALVASAWSFAYTGGAISLPTPQPSLPVATTAGSLALTSGTAVLAGGQLAYTSAAATSNVWTASWDPSTGTLGSWSSQNSLPTAVSYASSAVWDDTSTVYIVGGFNAADSATMNTVYWATVINGQVGTWNAGPSLPVAVASPYAAVINGWLVVAGGQSTTSAGSSVTNVYYSQINASTGAPGAWRAGPSLPVATASTFYPNGSLCPTGNAMVIIGGLGTSVSVTSVQVLPVTASGPASAWTVSNWTSQLETPMAVFSIGNGAWEVFSIFWSSFGAQYQYSTLTPVPYISIPLYATGLTSGNTYHVVMQQHQSATSADYLAWGVLDDTPLPDNALRSTRRSGTWTAVASGWSVPMSVYNTSVSGPVWHTWEDPDAYGCAQRTSTLLYNSYQLPIGVIEQTLKANPPRNANPTFTSGVSPWTATGGTLTQSSAQTHGGYAFSGLLTPFGTASTAAALSELFPVSQGGGPFYGASNWYLVDGWVYSPSGYGTISLSVAWYDQGSNLLSISSTMQSLTAATWTHAQNWVLAPAEAAFGQIQATESGTPASSALLYLSDVVLIASQECVGSLTSAAAIEYPASVPWPPVGVQQLL